MLCVFKTMPSFYLLERDERDLQHMTALAINTLSTGLATLTAYQLTFFAYCIKQRYEILVVLAEEFIRKFDFRKSFANTQENNKFIDNLASLHFDLADGLSMLNLTFSKEVRMFSIF